MAEVDIIRLSFFGGILAAVAAWEIIAPRRTLTDRKSRRWFTNLGMVAIDPAMLPLLLPILPSGMAFVTRDHGRS